MKRLLVVSAAVCALAAAPSALASPARSSADTVIAKTTGGVLIAGPRGLVTLAHMRAPVGTRVVRMGSRFWVIGLAHTAHFRGIVVAHRGNMLVLTAAHRLFTVGLAGRKLASNSPSSGPQAGDLVGVVVSIDVHGNITATSAEDDGPAGSSQVLATITSVGTDSVTLDVNGESVTLALPPGTTVPTTSVGTQVTLTLTFSDDETTAIADDQGEDEGQNQSGDQSSSNEDDNGGSGSTSSSDDGGTNNTSGDGGSGDGGGGGD